MTPSSPPARRLQPTGALREDALYIERSADQELFSALQSGEFCYVLAPRQIGKSSLRVRTARRLSKAKAHCAEIDLTSLGKSADRDPVGAWYFSLANRLADDLGLPDPKPFFEPLSALLPVERFGQYLRRQVLPQVPGRIVVFLDEIDFVRALPIDRDEFFVALRALYNERPQHPELERLTFCLLGVAAPRDLVRDPHITPFNIGHPVRLLDFSRSELAALTPALTALADDPAAWLDEIFAWTAGHPYMTQALCQEVVKQRGPQAEGSLAQRVERAVTLRFLRTGRSSDENLSYAEKRLEQSPHKAELLVLYRRLLADRRVEADSSDAMQQELMMCGLAALRDPGDGPPTLHVRNRIFARVFDATWVQEKEAQRLLTTAYRRWHEDGQRDLDLLSDEALVMAQTWAQDNPREVSSDEHEFLLRSVDYARRRAEQDKQLTEANLARERLHSAEQRSRTQRRIIYGLAASMLLLASLSLALYLQYRRAQAAVAAEQRARIAEQERAQAEILAEQRARRAEQERAQAEAAARKQHQALAAAKQKEWERAEEKQAEASAAKGAYEQKTRELGEQIRKTEDARTQLDTQQTLAERRLADLDESRRTMDSVSAARLAASPEHRLIALVQGLRAALPDVETGQIHPDRWEGLTMAATTLVGAIEVRRQHRTPISAAVSPDARHVAVGLLDGTVEFYLIGNPKPVWWTKPNGDAVWHLSFSKDMKYVAISHMGGSLVVLNSFTGDILREEKLGYGTFYADYLPGGHNMSISSLSVIHFRAAISSPEKKDILVPLIYTGINDGKIPYYDRVNNVIVIGNRKLKIGYNIESIARSEDAKLLAVSGSEIAGGIAILDGRNGNQIATLGCRECYCLQFTPDNSKLLTCQDFDGNKDIRLWDLNAVVGASWQGPTQYVSPIDALSDTGIMLHRLHGEGKVRVMDVRIPQAVKEVSVKLLNQYFRKKVIDSVSFAQNGQLLWANGRMVEIAKDKEIVRSDGNFIELIRISDGAVVHSVMGNNFVNIAGSGNGQYYFIADKVSVRRLSVKDDEVVAKWNWPIRLEYVPPIVVDEFGGKIATKIDRSIYLFDGLTGTVITQISSLDPKGYSDDHNVCRFSKDSDILIYPHGRELTLLDLPTLRTHSLRGHLGNVLSFAVSPDERFIASSADDKTVRVWQVETGKPWLVLPVDEPVAQLTFIDGGTRLLAVQRNGVVRTFPLDHLAYFRHGCRVLRGYDEITGVSEADRLAVLAACPAEGKVAAAK